MRRSIKREETYTRELVSSVTCDRCEREIKLPGDSYPFIEGGRVEASFGFGSSYDLEDYGWDICDNCKPALEEFFGASNQEKGQG